MTALAGLKRYREPSGVDVSSFSPAPLKVVYVIDKMGPGGAQTHLGGLILALDRRHFEPSLVCLVRGGPVADRIRDAGIPVQILGLRRVYGLRAARAFFALVRWLRQARPDVVHTYLSSANVYGGAAARVSGIPCLVTTRRDTGFGDGRLMRRALRATNGWAKRVVAVSQDVARVVREREGLREPRLAVVPNAIDVARFTPRGRRAAARAGLGLADEARVALAVTHLTPVKGVDVLVEAAAQVCARLPGAVFLVVGKGKERDRVLRRVRELGLEGSFRLLGERTDVPELLEAADVFVLPSRSEGHPNALLEAMAMALPVVVSRVGGVPEVVTDRAEGLLVAPGSPRALAEGCLELLTQPGWGAGLGRAGQERVRRDFDLGRMTHRYQALYEEGVRGQR